MFKDISKQAVARVLVMAVLALVLSARAEAAPLVGPGLWQWVASVLPGQFLPEERGRGAHPRRTSPDLRKNGSCADPDGHTLPQSSTGSLCDALGTCSSGS